MKFSEQWLREFVNPPVSTTELAAQLTMAGLEVDAVAPVAAPFGNVVVGEVVSVEPHPNAEKLKVCKVNVGQAAPLQIVCGASNVAAGLRVPCAMIGAELPGGMKIKKAALRGVESNGMLCSAKELGMAETSEGLMILPADAAAGTDVRKLLGCDDQTFELGLTPNRGDCLSVQGVAREVAAINSVKLTIAEPAAIAAQIADTLPVALEAAADCPRYCGRVVRGINARAASPLWLQERLRRSGVRSISAIVDVTNYVMLEMGQPMHAFDLAKLSGGILVRKSKPAEELQLLDQREIELKEGSLVIADQRSAQALAGIMGGLASSVTDATRDIFLESAFFAPAAIAGRAREYGMHTDSSHRFERGVDPTMQRKAIERATALILQIAGGRPGPVIDVADQKHLPTRAPFVLRRARIARVLGVQLTDSEVADICVRLGMTSKPTPDGWSIEAPAHRFDIAREIDMIEELARIYGYNRIPARNPGVPLAMLSRAEGFVSASELRRVLTQRGYQEVITYSFVDPTMQAMLDPARTSIMLANPIASDMSAMRTSLWPGLIKTLMHNLNRQQDRVRIFEHGMRFLRDGANTIQDMVIGGLVYGHALPEQWGDAKRPVDFFDAKGDVEHVIARAATGRRFDFVRGEHPALHPGRSASIVCDGRPAGWIGELHPSLIRKLDLPSAPILFEVEGAAVARAAVPRFSEISRFPAIRRDIAVVVSAAVSYSDLADAIRAHAPGLLQHFQLFDVYAGKGIEPGTKSLALGLTFQALERTLSDGDVDHDVQHIVAVLDKQFGAKLRS
jgi:phenylalanyl-tRNA synthetase beta chain